MSALQIETIKELALNAELAQERLRVGLHHITRLPEPNPPLGENVIERLVTENSDASTALLTAAKAAGLSWQTLTTICENISFAREMGRINGLTGYDGEEEFLGKVHLLQLTPQEKKAHIERYHELNKKKTTGPSNWEGGRRKTKFKRKNRKRKSNSRRK